MYRRCFLRKCLMTWVVIVMYFILNIFTLKHAAASEHPILYLFWRDGCPHCEEEKEFLKKLHERYPELEIRWFEIWDHPEFMKLADAMQKAYKMRVTSVPMTFLGKWAITGFMTEDTTGIQIEEQVIRCFQQGCGDALEVVDSLPIVKKIKEEASRNDPVDWEHYPPLSRTKKE